MAALRGQDPKLEGHRPMQARPPVGPAGGRDERAPPHIRNNVPLPPNNNTVNQSVIDIPSTIVDSKTEAQYIRGKLLGKGGFARCYEVVNKKDQSTVACKIVNKTLLTKPHQREKMGQEIRIHRELNHEFVVQFISYFEDDANVYITLELCSNKSLMELQKRRRIVTEPEAKYFMKQIVNAMQYLHDVKHVVHRDLKLGNIFISVDMNVKIGDFGLATTIQFDGERKKTLCGTPNYIAPEVLIKKGHSYEVDLWSIGCILYTLLVGRPPFETATLKDTYYKIKRGEYYYPSNVRVSDAARKLIGSLLQVNPALRPSASQILADSYLTQGYIPTHLPASVLTMAPRFDTKATVALRKEAVRPPPPVFKTPLSLANPTSTPIVGQRDVGKATIGNNMESGTGSVVSRPSQEGKDGGFVGELSSADIIEYLRNLKNQVQKIITANPAPTSDDDESEDPSQCPMLWICKWVDYSDKYGFGYQLTDDSVGVSFNDQTKIILLADGRSLHYIDKCGKEMYYSLASFPDELSKKVKLLKYFEQYMQDNLVKTTGGKTPPNADCIARVPNMWTWFRTSRSVVMVLSNGTVQINNFRDHSKMILCPLLGALTTLATTKSMNTYTLANMEKGLSPEMMERLVYALEKIEVILGNPRLSPHASVASPVPAKRS